MAQVDDHEDGQSPYSETVLSSGRLGENNDETADAIPPTLSGDTAAGSTRGGDESVGSDKRQNATQFVGGPTNESAFCLLDGFVEDPSSGKVPFRLPINRLPANLGRTHVPTENAKHFFGLGKTVKALSRLQCKIEYRTNHGLIGPLQDPSVSSSTKFVSSKLAQLHNPTKEDLSDDEVGYFVVTCLGKNPIKVNGQKVEQNESCVLTHGSAVKISAFCLYFLLPESDPSTEPPTLSITAQPGQNSSKKRSRSAMEASSAFVEPTLSSSSAGAGGGKKFNRGNAWTSIQEQLDSMSTEDLLQQLNAALEKNIWDRRCQFMGATVAYRAVREAALSPEIQRLATDGGISKAEVVDWIHASERFKDWAFIMQAKLEPKSYQSSISKAMARAGFERINNKNFGRHVRWYLPADIHENPNRQQIYLESKKHESKDSQEGEEDDENEDGEEDGEDGQEGGGEEDENEEDDDNPNAGEEDEADDVDDQEGEDEDELTGRSVNDDSADQEVQDDGYENEEVNNGGVDMEDENEEDAMNDGIDEAEDDDDDMDP